MRQAVFDAEFRQSIVHGSDTMGFPIGLAAYVLASKLRFLSPAKNQRFKIAAPIIQLSYCAVPCGTFFLLA